MGFIDKSSQKPLKAPNPEGMRRFEALVGFKYSGPRDPIMIIKFFL